MAVTQAYSPRSVAQWFGKLTFDEQDNILTELSKLHVNSKASKIRELKQQLQKLEGLIGVSLKSVDASKKPHAAKGVKVAPKYRDKKTGQTWAGRGVQPVWLREKLAKGAKLDSFLIAK